MKAPIVICGCPGSGTSLVTKMLRHAGLFVGADSGPADARKYHESQCFKKYNQLFLDKTIAFPHAPKSVEQFRDHGDRMKADLESFVQSVGRAQLLDEFFDGQNRDVIWGWKDPRNSATVMIWKEIFPQLRVVSISRNWRWRDRWLNRFNHSGSDSGKWYRQQSTAELRELYAHPIGLEGTSVLHIDVDQVTSNANFFGRVLTWCGLDSGPASRFDSFLEDVGFESK